MPLKSLFTLFLKIGLLSFGGPAAQISLMHRLLVQEKKHLNEQQFLNALGFCMLLPGPEAMQLATYAGWKMRGITGGLIAGLLFVIPGAIVMLALAILYMSYNDLAIVDTLFLGIQAAVLIIVFEALHKVSKRALITANHWMIACFAFIAIFFFSLPFPLVIISAALYGFYTSSNPAKNPKIQIISKTSWLRTLTVLLTGLLLWCAPIVLLDQLLDTPIISSIALFFAKLAVVTFGGAYAVLVYMAQDVVSQYHWLSATQMIDGLGLAETTPGPLILVTEFVGFIAGFREGGLWLGIIAAGVTLWVTFVPCFIWIFVGAPYIEWIHTQHRLSNALANITAAVVGVILNLAVWFSLHVFFLSVEAVQYGPITLHQPQMQSLNWHIVVLSLLCAFLLLRLQLNIVKVLCIAAATAWLLSHVST
ncbi:MAG: chromate efflux transporter [Oceanospirillaceae bacterium]|nr:chromate efflux transporter [Oceanospirillaceae bacterium]